MLRHRPDVADIDADCVCLNWRTMTDNNLVTDDKKSTLEKRFTQEAPVGTRDHNGIVANHFVKWSRKKQV